MVTKLIEKFFDEVDSFIGIGPDTAAQILITFENNAHRIHPEAAFVKMCGAYPLPASSGKTQLID